MGNIKNLHANHRERLRNRFLKEGLDNFESYQVLELLISFSIPYKDVNETAHSLINEFGSLSGVLEADQEELIRIKGISNKTAVFLRMMPELTRLYFKDKWEIKKKKLNDISLAGEYAIALMAGRTHEVFYVLCLDSQCQIAHAVLAHEGTINEAAVYPRTIVEIALRHKANSVILSHNHPGGSIRPSNADIHVTEKIKNALNPISIDVLDHIVVGGNDYFSFAENNLI